MEKLKQAYVIPVLIG
jgi:hypothetical protein